MSHFQRTFRNVTLRSIFLQGIVLLIFGVVIGCSDNSGETDWRSVLQELDSEEAHFSFMYRGASAEDSTFRISVHQQQNSNACSFYDYEQEQSGTPEFWYLAVTLSDTELREYQVSPDDLDETDSARALVRLVHVRGWEKADTYPALRGTVTLREAPQSSAEWHAGHQMVADVSAHFPVNPAQLIRCDGEVNEDGTGAFSECICERETGQRFTCTPDDVDHNCCFTPSTETFSFELNVSANQCANMCRVTSPGLQYKCEELK